MVVSTVRKLRNPYWQMMRAIAIIAVIYIHSTPLGINASLLSLDGLWYLFVRNLLNFPVALFFFISGFFTKNPLNMVKNSGGTGSIEF